MLQSRTSSDSARNGMAGARLSVNLTRYMGVETSLLHLFPATPNASGIDKEGNRLTISPYIDFTCLRVYAEYFNSSEAGYNAGYGAGLKLFF